MQQSLLDIVTRQALRVGVPFQASRTSRKAAEQLAPKVAGRREQVLALFRAGARLTADEAAVLLEWKPTQTRPRVCEAAKWGILVDTGSEFRPPGVTHSAPLGRRSFLQIPPPLWVSLKWAGSERFL